MIFPELTPARILDDRLNFLRHLARNSLCTSRCAALLMCEALELDIGAAHNGPPKNSPTYQKCGQLQPSRRKPKTDRTCCVHAEQRALLQAQRHGALLLPQSVLYFARIDDADRLAPSGDPYCTVCSKLALDAGVKGWVLWHADGPRYYPSDLYNELSHEFDARGGPP